MPKALKIILFIIAGLIIVAIAGFYIMRFNTKKHSPEDTVVFKQDSLKIEVFYNRPYKKGRDIFGNIVAYNEVWRTGANEATTFKTNKDLLIEGSLLEAGKYTLWTIPNETSWVVIFNDKMYNWGVNFSDGKASRVEKFDVLKVEVPVSKNLKTIEQFSIYFDEQFGDINMFLAWDDIVVPVSIKPAKT
ncbi:DUF2911 domain-containing protein [Flavobacterium sp. CS20]|jgi:hypothetical protein|uniref:DUF2911 domain-containing protein n=1 Tax=Flavobacterium sp. CS20 TaxID=2775246 RepID=UPI001B3A11D7|nr:DUF2911 domain-containing protein [Flavobacterium sp. CS20]QTY27551.1 DUF2911 domain-containing protein [Flavobacterium sp. CS20]